MLDMYAISSEMFKMWLKQGVCICDSIDHVISELEVFINLSLIYSSSEIYLFTLLIPCKNYVLYN